MAQVREAAFKDLVRRVAQLEAIVESLNSQQNNPQKVEEKKTTVKKSYIKKDDK